MAENKEKLPLTSKLDWFTDERCIGGIPAVALLQIILALLLYMIAALDMVLLLPASAAALVLGFAGYYLAEKPVVRFLVRALLVILTVGIIGFGIAAMVMFYNEFFAIEEPGGLSDLVFLLLFSFSLMLFVQAAASGMVKYRRRFDLVLLRIIAIIVLAMAVLFCVFGLEYRTGGTPLVIRSFSTPEIFGMSLEIAIDNIITRALLCLFSLSIVFMSFRLRSLPSKPSRPDDGQ